MSRTGYFIILAWKFVKNCENPEEESKVGGANIAGLATPPRRNPAGIIPSYMAVFEFSKLKRLILSGKDVKIRQNCKKGAIYTFLLHINFL